MSTLVRGKDILDQDEIEVFGTRASAFDEFKKYYGVLCDYRESLEAYGVGFDIRLTKHMVEQLYHRYHDEDDVQLASIYDDGIRLRMPAVTEVARNLQGTLEAKRDRTTKTVGYLITTLLGNTVGEFEERLFTGLEVLAASNQSSSELSRNLYRRVQQGGAGVNWRAVCVWHGLHKAVCAFRDTNEYLMGTNDSVARTVSQHYEALREALGASTELQFAS